MRKITRNPNHPWFNDQLEIFCKEKGEEYHKKREAWRKKEGKNPSGNWTATTKEKWKRYYGNEEWGKIEKYHKEHPDSKESWDEKKSIYLNLTFLPFLKAMTEKRCSYCDCLVGKASRPEESIDHFKPKTEPLYETLIFQWENLFLSCSYCQDTKGTEFDEKLLRPDSPKYEFRKYFSLDFQTGEIKANPNCSEKDQKNADFNIKFYGWNQNGAPEERANSLECYQYLMEKGKENPLSRCSYRFFIEEHLFYEKEKEKRKESGKGLLSQITNQ